MRTRTPLLALLASVAVLDGCACDSVPDTAITSCELNRVVPGAVKTDILFVIDDSGSMAEEHVLLQAGLTQFIQDLQSSPVANDFQVAVTTTSVDNFAGTAVGAQGAFVGTPAVLSGDDPDLVTLFTSRVAVGTAGSGKEQPFRAMKLALSSPLIDAGNANAGFLRAGSRLAVVFLSDEDDCSDSATPRGITSTTTTTGNNQCHNDAGDGVDYKFTRIDPIGDYEGFLKGATGPAGAQEARDVVLAAIVGVDATEKAPTCGDTNNSWCCGSASNDTCVANQCGANALTVSGLPGTTYCCGGATGTACTSSCASAFDKADRFEALLGRFPAAKTLSASVCDSSFAQTLAQIAGLIVSQTVPLEGAPADYHMLVVGVRKPDGSRVSCTVAAAGSASAASADAVYEPPTGAEPAKLTFQNGCALDSGDKIEIDVVCAG